LPFVTEEIWSWWRAGSIHQAAWPTGDEVETLLPERSDAERESDQQTYEWAIEVLSEIRRQRSESKQPLRVPITRVTITAEPEVVALMPRVEDDLKAALRVQQFECSVGTARTFTVAGYDAPPAS
jgi:valyl-tRNA synthetase